MKLVLSYLMISAEVFGLVRHALWVFIFFFNVKK